MYVLIASYGSPSVALKKLPSHRYLPIMISRLMLSLRKVANASEISGWSLTSVTHTTKHSCNMSFAPVPMLDEDITLPTEGGAAPTTIPSAMGVLVSRGELIVAD